jgi:hypothetical protein
MGQKVPGWIRELWISTYQVKRTCSHITKIHNIMQKKHNRRYKVTEVMEGLTNCSQSHMIEAILYYPFQSLLHTKAKMG